MQNNYKEKIFDAVWKEFDCFKEEDEEDNNDSDYDDNYNYKCKYCFPQLLDNDDDKPTMFNNYCTHPKGGGSCIFHRNCDCPILMDDRIKQFSDEWDKKIKR